MKNKILLLGGSGLLGKKLLETVPQNYFVIPTYNSYRIPHKNSVKLDITNKQTLHELVLNVKPNVIIHTASWVYVDECEKNKQQAWNVNVIGTQNVVSAARYAKAKLVFFSSNGVYGGRRAPYDEEAPHNPLNYYGKTKSAAERVVKQYISHSIIFRLNTMFGWAYPDSRKNPATWTIERLTRKMKTYVVTDNFNSHLWVGQAAQAVWQGIYRKTFGNVFQVGGKDCINRFDFCCAVADVFNLDKNLLIPVKSNYFKHLAKRPRNTCFISDKMEKSLDVKTVGVYEGLHRMKNETSH